MFSRHDQRQSIIDGANARRSTLCYLFNLLHRECWWVAHGGDAPRGDLRYLRDRSGRRSRWRLVVNGGHTPAPRPALSVRLVLVQPTLAFVHEGDALG